MRPPSSLVLNLRVGCYTASDGSSGAVPENCLALLPEGGGENAWGLDALLAVAGQTAGAAENPTLRGLQDCLRDTPGDGDLRPLLPLVLDAAVRGSVGSEGGVGSMGSTHSPQNWGAGGASDTSHTSHTSHT